MKNLAENHRLRKRGSIWYYVRRVPVKLVPVLGKDVIKVSLKTADKSEAKKLRTIEDVKSDALFAETEKSVPSVATGTIPTKQISTEMLLQYVRDAVAKDDQRSADEFAKDPPDENDQLIEMVAEAESQLQILKNPVDPRRYMEISHFASQILKEFGPELAKFASLEHRDLLGRGLIEIYKRKLARFNYKNDKPFYDYLFDPDANSTISFGSLSEAYLAEKEQEDEINNVSQKGRDKTRSTMRTLVEIVGKEFQVDQIGDQKIQHVKLTLANLPRNRTKHYPNLSIDDAIAKAKKDDRPLLASQTQRDYLSSLKRMLDFAVRRQYLGHNPIEKPKPLKKDSIPQHQKRLPLKSEQLQEFFTRPFYQNCAPGAGEPYNKPDRDWQFWIPLIMLFSGARPNEIAQLRVSDVIKSNAGTLYLDLIDEDGKQSEKIAVKTFSSRRKIPVHSELKRFGFEAFVTRMKDLGGTDSRLFPRLKPDRYGNFARYAAKRMNEKFLPASVRQDSRRCLYSLRHNVRDALRRVDAPPDALRAIAGWSNGGKLVSDMYGDPNDPDHYVKWVDKISYPGLDLSFLHV